MQTVARIKGEVCPVEAVWSKKWGVWHRPDTSDLAMIKDCVKNYKAVYEHPSMKGATVVDLGANVGHFAKLCVAHGAAQVICVEADWTNCEMIKINLVEEIRLGKVVLLNQAISKVSGERVRFYTGNSKQSLCSGSTVASRARPNFFEVSTISLAAIEHEYGGINVIKCDIEGGEYDLLDDGLTNFLDDEGILAMELHRGGQDLQPRYDAWFEKLTTEWNVLYRHDNIVFSQLFAVDLVLTPRDAVEAT